MAITIDGTNGITSPGGDSVAVDIATPKVKNAGTLALEATGANVITFSNNGAESARTDSSGNLVMANRTGTSTGQIRVGRTNNLGSTNGYLVVAADSSEPFPIAVRGESTDQGLLGFFDSTNSEVGRIAKSGSNTTYVTSSDYRLKENIAPMTGALAKVAALKPVTYTWKASGETDEGFIAHELAEVCPSAVSGEKDAVNEDGSIKPQGIDTSFLVATLTAALQELKAINDAQAQTIESLTARIEALEQA